VNRLKSVARLAIAPVAALALALVSLQTGCAGPTSPTSPPQVVTPTPPPPPAPPASSEVIVSGHIVDNIYRGLADVRVEVVEGSGLGAAATTNASGDYALPGVFSGAISLRASKAGYVTQTQTFQLSPRDSGRYELGFLLDSPSQNLAGDDYTLTITADPACSELPPETHSRTYEATVTPSASVSNAYNVELRGASFSPSRNRIFASVSGDSVRFDIDPYSDMIVAEQLTASTVLTVWGNSSVGKIGPSISVPFAGQLDYCPDALGTQGTFPYLRCGITPVHCSSARHTLTLARR
jgi:hypothetical protein